MKLLQSIALKIGRDPSKIGTEAIGEVISTGYAELDDRRFDQGRLFFEYALAKDPTNCAALEGLAFSFQRDSKFASAAEAWKNALDKTESSAPTPDLIEFRSRVALQIGICAHMTGDVGACEASLKLARFLSPNVERDPNYHLFFARVAALSDKTKAIQIALAALDLAPDDTAILFDVSSWLNASGHPAKAHPHIRKLLAACPDDRSFLMLAADCYELSSAWHSAETVLEKLRLVSPNFDVYRRLVFVIRKQGAIKRLRQVVLSSIKDLSGELAFVAALAEAYDQIGQMRRGRLLRRFLSRRWPHARDIQVSYANALAANGKLAWADAHILRCLAPQERADTLWRTAQSAGAYDEALRRLRASAASNNISQQVDLGYLMADACTAAEALNHFQNISASFALDDRTLVGQAHMAVRLRDKEASVRYWEHAAVVGPDNAHSCCEYARALFETGRHDLAYQAATASLRRFPNERGVVEFVSWLLLALGHFSESLELCRQQLDNYPDSWRLLDNGLISAGYISCHKAFIKSIDLTKMCIQSSSDVQQLYQLCRSASLFKCLDDLSHAFIIPDWCLASHPWTERYNIIDNSTTRLNPCVDNLYSFGKVNGFADNGKAEYIRVAEDEEIMAILDSKSGDAKEIHIFNKFEQPEGGSELHALDLARNLSKFANVQLWSISPCHDQFKANKTVKVIDVSAGSYPSSGTFVFVGLYFDVGNWLGRSAPQRIVALYNTFEASKAVDNIRIINAQSKINVELIYCSDLMEKEMGVPGIFEPSPTDIIKFYPDLERSNRPSFGARQFVIGRHSRDVVEKHHPEDSLIYQHVEERGGRSVIRGGLCMARAFKHLPTVRLQPASSHNLVQFLQSLDCYFYRTGTWVEPWGRVVIEALACGVPVVAHRYGGYAQAIKHGDNGFLFESSEEAIQHVDRLMRDEELRLRMSARARESAENLVSDGALARNWAFYLL